MKGAMKVIMWLFPCVFLYFLVFPFCVLVFPLSIFAKKKKKNDLDLHENECEQDSATRIAAGPRNRWTDLPFFSQSPTGRFGHAGATLTSVVGDVNVSGLFLWFILIVISN